jgi:hypothetical protein
MRGAVFTVMLFHVFSRLRSLNGCILGDVVATARQAPAAHSAAMDPHLISRYTQVFISAALVYASVFSLWAV